VIGNQEGRTYIVTGATSGIGKELTKELAAKNATVIMACRFILQDLTNFRINTGCSGIRIDAWKCDATLF
jgi:NAD(P)-dependent dehydrogenase (short-subunit alcohol dehydrogenase family)